MLKKLFRLRRESDIKKIHVRGRVYFSSCANLKILANGQGHSRFAVIVSAKTAPKATARNRLRRQISEIVRLNWTGIRSGYDCLIVAKKSLAEVTHQNQKRAVINLLDRANIWLS